MVNTVRGAGACVIARLQSLSCRPGLWAFYAADCRPGARPVRGRAGRREFVHTAAVAAALSQSDTLSANARAETAPRPLAEVPADRPIRVGALVFPRMDQIDLTGPFAVLSRLPNATVRLLWKTTDPVRDSRGLGLIPDARLADAGPIDLLVVPGGPGQEDLMEDEAVLSFVSGRAAAATCVFSVCTGALVCEAARLLRGRRAATHWASVQFLRYFGATAVDRRVVTDGKLVSAAGLTAGIDGALRVAARVMYFQYVEGSYETHSGDGEMGRAADTLDGFMGGFFDRP